MVSIRPPISNSSSPFSKSFCTVLRAQITTGITVTLMPINLLSSLASISLSFHFLLVRLNGNIYDAARYFYVVYWHLFYFMWFISTKPGLLNGIRLSNCISKSQKNSWVSRPWFLFMNMPFGIMVRFQFLSQYPFDHLTYSVVSRLMLLLRNFAAILILCDWLFLFCHNIIYTIAILPHINDFCLVLMALFCAIIDRDSISLRFPFRNHVQVVSCKISPICLLKYL